MKLSFIVIDDSELDCFIARKIIDHTDKELHVETYLNGNDVIPMLEGKAIRVPENEHTVILLDLQMPIMDGFQFVEEFEKLPEHIQKKFLIVVLSSTRNSNDIFRIFTYKAVHSLMEKPLTREKLLSLINQVS